MEFTFYPLYIDQDPFDKFREIQERFKELFPNYKLTSLHTHIIFKEASYGFVNRLIDCIMPLAINWRAVKQNSLLDAWSQHFNIFRKYDRGLVRIRRHTPYNGLELRFAGKYYGVYEDIIEAVSKIPETVSRSELLEYNDITKEDSNYYNFYGYPDSIKKMMSLNHGKNHDVYYAMLKYINSSEDIKKFFMKESYLRQGHDIMITYLFPFFLGMWDKYVPVTNRYIYDELLPNLPEKLKYHILGLRRNKYKYPIIRAWKNMLRQVGSKALRYDYQKMLDNISKLTPLNEFDTKYIDELDVYGWKVRDVVIPDTSECSLPSVRTSGLGESNFMYTCPHLSIETNDTGSRSYEYCDIICEKRRGSVCCIYCDKNSRNPYKRCEYLCTIDNKRCDRILPRNPYLYKNKVVVYPSSIAFDICHDCVDGDCSKCKCLTCEDMSPSRCSSCIDVKYKGFIPHNKINPADMKYYKSKGSSSFLKTASCIFCTCENFLVHQDISSMKCATPHCDDGACCYLCKKYYECEDKCTMLGDKDEFWNNLKAKPHIINPNMPDDIKQEKTRKYEYLVELENPASIDKIYEELKHINNKYWANLEDYYDFCDGCRYSYIRNCFGCKYLNVGTCSRCFSNIRRIPQNKGKLCTECTRNVGFWLQWHKKHEMFIAHSTDINEFICKDNEKDIAPDDNILEHVEPRRSVAGDCWYYDNTRFGREFFTREYERYVTVNADDTPCTSFVLSETDFEESWIEDDEDE